MFFLRAVCWEEEFTPAALNFLSPILDALRRGTDSESLAIRASSSSLHELATERRGCEQIIRLTSNLQVLVDCLQICHQVKNFNFNIINSDIISAANEIIHSNFGMLTIGECLSVLIHCQMHDKSHHDEQSTNDENYTEFQTVKIITRKRRANTTAGARKNKRTEKTKKNE
ncbi:unnamed protein product [Didymodactylos carnosus]|uniref:Uncharacterized protein n=1 Tax=Didymodactylos carnosus TaxID=1234261 RepID=A0A8S2R4Z5_9BILA|nr:unnamed protein product [Didymodactylos carnosus]CAF4145429.1 unnamed protein product [Didymodactylos carnosus]